MHLHRWTCLTTVILTTVISPIATVATRASSLVVGSEGNYISPQSLPTITPLRVTELQTDAVIPVVRLVPQVTKLPTVPLLNSKIRAQATFKQRQLAKAPHVEQISPLSPADLIRSTAPNSPNFPATESQGLLANPTDTPLAPVHPVLPLPSLTAQAPRSRTFIPVTPPAATAPTPIGSNGSQSPTQIASSTTTAQIPHIWQTQDSGFGMGNSKLTAAAGKTIEKSQLNSAPQVTPIISYPQDKSDLPGFEAGSPIFVFNHQPAQQIVATTIAQVGETIVAPEPSIAIPIQRPQQPIVPAVVPATATTDRPSTTSTKPALEQIVATQTGQASWYGSEGGPQTASGERYDPSGLTAAHRTLPFGTQVRVTSLKTGKTVTVRINDRGPWNSRRIVDISAGAAEVIGIKDDGVGDVRMEILAAKG